MTKKTLLSRRSRRWSGTDPGSVPISDPDSVPDSFGAVGTADLAVALAVFVRRRQIDVHWTATDLAVLDQRTADLGLEVDFNLLPTIRAGDDEDGVHRYMMRQRHEVPDAYDCRSRARDRLARRAIRHRRVHRVSEG